MPVIYRKVVNLNEEREPFLLIDKKSLSKFPPVGINFKIIAGRKGFRTRIFQKACQCTGAPHFHYYMDIKSIKMDIKKDKVKFEIKKVQDKYYLKIS